MKSIVVLLLAAAALSACAGLDVTPVSPAQVRSAHRGGEKLDGYVVYAPMIVIEMGMNDGVLCSVGKPFLLPDTASPFLVNTRTGFGSTSVVLTIHDGWLLTGITNRSGNAAVERLLENLPTLITKSLNAAGFTAARTAPPGECPTSLYRVEVKGTQVVLSRLSVETT